MRTLIMLFVTLATAVVAPCFAQGTPMDVAPDAAALPPPATTTQPAATADLEKRVADLEAAVEDLRAHGLRADHPRVVAIERQLASIERMLAARGVRHVRQHRVHRGAPAKAPTPKVESDGKAVTATAKPNYITGMLFPLWREHQELKMTLREKNVIDDDDLKRISGASADKAGETRKKKAEFDGKHGLTAKPAEKTEEKKDEKKSDIPKVETEPGKSPAPNATPAPSGPSAEGASHRYQIQPVPSGNVVNAVWDGGPVRVMLAAAEGKTPPTEAETKKEETKVSDIKVLCRRDEEVIPGVLVVLYNSDHKEIVRGNSGPKEGRVTFKGVPDGDYYVRVESFPNGYFPAEVTQAVGGKDAISEVKLEFKTAGDLANPSTVTVPEETVTAIAKKAASDAAAQTAAKDVRVTATTDPVLLVVAIGLGILALVIASVKRGAAGGG